MVLGEDGIFGGMRVSWGLFVSLGLAQLTGEYLVNGTSDLGGRSFATLQEAFNTLFQAGAQDTVLFRIVHPYDPGQEPPTIWVRPYVCQTCQVIVRADTAVTIATRPRAEWWEGQYVLRIQGGVQRFYLNGRNRLRLKSLTDTTGFTGVIGIAPRSSSVIQYIRIDSCILEGSSRRGTWAALYVGDSVSLFPQPISGNVFISNLVISGCILRGARYAAVFLSPGWGNLTQVTFSQNTLGYPVTNWGAADSSWGNGGAALYARYVVGLLVERNLAQGAWEAGPYSPVGFRIEYANNAILRANRIVNLRQLSPEGYGAVGIHCIRETRYGPSPYLLENNFVGDIVGGADESLPRSSTYAVAGILLESDFQPDAAATYTLRHNTVHLYGSAQTSAPWAKDGFCAGIIIGRNIRGGVELSSNLIQNTLQLSSTLLPDAKETCGLLFWENPADLQWSTFILRHNFYFVRGAVAERTYIARVGWGLSKQGIGSLAEWRALTGQEAQSYYGPEGPAPLRVPNAPHIDPGIPWVGISRGYTPPLTALDYDGDVRPLGGATDSGAAPDIGADELAGTELPCPVPMSQPLTASLTSGRAGEPVSLSVSTPSTLAGELVLLWSTDGGTTWSTLAITADQFPVSLPLPVPATFPGQVLYRLAALPLPGCPGAADTSAPVAIQILDRGGNRPQNAIPLVLTPLGGGIWEATQVDSLTGYGTTDIFSPLGGSATASTSPDLFFTLTLPDCLDSLEIDLCGTETDFDTRLHLLMGGDTITDRDQGYRADCLPTGVPTAYTSRIVAVGSDPANVPAAEDFFAPERPRLPLPPGASLQVVVEGETPLDVGHFRLAVRAYKLPLPKPDLGPDRTVCQSTGGIRLSAPVPGATAYAWYVNGQLLPTQTDSVAFLPLDLGEDTIIVEVRRDPPQSCAQVQTQRDTVVLTVLPDMQATILYEGTPQSNKDTLTLPFGTYTLTAQAQVGGASFSWQVWDAREVLIDWQTGSSYVREWGVRGLYQVELLSQAGSCEERDTLFLRIVEPTGSLTFSPSLPMLWPNPTEGEVFLQLPEGGLWQIVGYDPLGRIWGEWHFQGGGVYKLLLPEMPGLYGLSVRNGMTSHTALLLRY